MARLDGRIAFVTGAGRGIGRAIAEKLAAEGAAVVVTDLDEDSARTTAKAIGAEAVGMPADVTSRESVRQAVAEARARVGRAPDGSPGAKVLQLRSVEYARNHGMPLEAMRYDVSTIG